MTDQINSRYAWCDLRMSQFGMYCLPRSCEIPLIYMLNALHKE